MYIKSLLLGSAAALVAVTGARAADAVITAEPELIEYVRVCDVYGDQYYYIPGTETCLKIEGFVRFQVGTADNLEPEGWDVRTRAQLDFDARTETEWGRLRGFLRLRATNDDNTADQYALTQGFIQLGGLHMGFAPSAWAFPVGVPGIAGGSAIRTDGGGSYRFQDRQQIGYTFSGGNGVFGSIVLEDDDMAGRGYMPDVVGLAGVSQGWGGVWGKAAYDESAEEWAGQIGMQFNIPNMAGSNIRAIGYYSSGVNAYSPLLPVSLADSEWSVGVGYTHVFDPKWRATVGGQYFEAFDGDTAWHVAAAVVWVPLTNFEIRLEGTYTDEDSGDVANGFLRFTRYF